jgi:hypothetical protein
MQSRMIEENIALSSAILPDELMDVSFILLD